jgi:sirohydrochlorin cobaltochelatase
MIKAFPDTGTNGRPGLLLVGHGTRNAAGLAEFFAIAQHVADIGRDFDVEPCFLELAEPDIATGVRRLLARGVRQLIVAPVLLFAAGHATRDVPAAVDAAIRDPEMKPRSPGAPALPSVLHVSPLECHDKILQLSTERFYEALTNRDGISSADTLLIMVGRGSSYPEAIAKMREFTALRTERTPVARAETCFVAIAKPTLREILALAAETSYRRVVVQPHLLFTGDVLAEINRGVNGLREQQPHREWIVTPYLGPSPLVAEAILDLARSTLTTSQPRPASASA